MSDNNQPNDEQPPEAESSAPNSVDEEKLMRKLREEQRELQERMRMLDKDLRILRRKSRRSGRARATSFDEDDDDFPEFKIRMHRSADNLGHTLEAYIGNIMDSVADGIEGALDGIFTIGDRAETRRRRATDRRQRAAKRFRRKVGRRRYNLTEEDRATFPKEGATILGILSDERRLKILQHLETGPAYQKELSEATGVIGGQWKHHADQLKEAGYIDQEAVRGRYLITQLGREALKLAEMLYIRKKTISQVPDSETDSDVDDDEKGKSAIISEPLDPVE
ncbi:MAG: ArsR/SmtB family transcription factor [Candidatus Heimdallarchaeota archaeon]